ncbi:hypothetical protein Q9966_016619 [Columba livia]|nr:hypothetical protein Q9966_016619 [Columba livia]
MAFHEMEEHWVLDLVTQVALGVSLVALVAAVATFLLCRALKGLRTTLHLHLSLCLLLAQGTFLLGINRTEPPVREWYRSMLCPGAKRYSEFTSNTSNTSNTRVNFPKSTPK